MNTRIIIFLTVYFVILSCTRTENTDNNHLREYVSFNGGWFFSTDTSETGLQNNWQHTGIPDSFKNAVTLPHTWNVQKGLELYHGLAWYEKSFYAPETWSEKQVRIKFGAIHRNAHIYLNGKLIGEHIGAGYTTFYVDITEYLNIKDTNKLVISCENKFTLNSIPYAQKFDWANDGGIHRNVDLIITNKQAIDFVHVTPLITDKTSMQGKLDLKLKLLNPAQSRKNKIKVKLCIAEENQAHNNVIYDQVITLRKDDDYYRSSVSLSDIRLWHFDQPNLYKLTFVLLESGDLVDEYSTISGFKTFEVKDGEFYLNDELVRLPGIEWMPGSNPYKGFAEDSCEIVKMLSLMKELNCVITRFHWQQDERIIDWCNRNGILVQQELPHWQEPNTLNDSLRKSINLQIHEMITRDYNAPCLYSWGIGNELNGQSEEVNDFLMQTRELIRNNYDSIRLISYTSNTVHEDPAKDAAQVGDFIMWNDYQGTWHSNTTDSIGIMLDEIHEAFPDKPIMVAEFGLCEPQFSGGDNRRIQDLYIHTDYYMNRPYVSGAIYFSLNDYRTQKGEAGKGSAKQRVHGVTDLTGNKKPSFDHLKELWSPIRVIKTTARTNNKIEITIQCKDVMPSYSANGYMICTSDGECIIQQTPLHDLRPGDKATIELLRGSKLSIIRPNGFECYSTTID